jgi:hypothetical protein
VVIDRDDRHIYQPGLLFVPFGLAEPEEIVRKGTQESGPECYHGGSCASVRQKPTPRTVRMYARSPGVSPSLRRNQPMWTSSVLGSVGQLFDGLIE